MTDTDNTWPDKIVKTYPGEKGVEADVAFKH